MKIYKVIVGELQTNCYIVASDKGDAFIIDPGDDAQNIKGVLAQHNLKASFLVNTHGHIDHIKANADLKLPLYIHEKEKDMGADPRKNTMAVFFGHFTAVKPERLLKDGDRVVLDELSFEVIHTPGHTNGGICLLGEGVLFSGDTLFYNGVGRTDFPGASHAELLKSLKKLSQLKEDIRVYPGHGPDTTIGREAKAGTLSG